MADQALYLKRNKSNAIIASVFIDNKEIDITEGVKQFTIIKQSFKPIYVLKATINNQILKKIKFEKKIKFKVKIYSNCDSIRNADINNMKDNNNLKLQANLLLTLFNDNDIYYNIENKINSKTKYTENLAFTDDTSEVQFELFEYKNIDTDSVFINKTYKNVKLIDVVSDVTKHLNYDKYIVTKFDNQNTYKEIFINNMKIVEVIKYLNTTYGFYTTGLKLFLDNNIFMMYKMNKPIKTNSNFGSSKEHIVNLLIDRNNQYKKDDLKSFKANICSKSEQLNIALDLDFTISNNTYKALKLNGTNFILNDESNKDCKNTTKVDLLSNNDIKEKLLLHEIKPKSSFINNHYKCNRFYLNNYIQKNILNKLVLLNISLDNIPLNDIPIFALFNARFASTKNKIYNGLYAIENMIITYTANNNHDITSKTDIKLYKIEEI